MLSCDEFITRLKQFKRTHTWRVSCAIYQERDTKTWSKEDLKSCCYKADGSHTAWVGRRAKELSLVKVTGHSGLADAARGTQDHIRGGFGVLSVLHEECNYGLLSRCPMEFV